MSCGRTKHIPGGHTEGCGFCDDCVNSEQYERYQEDVWFRRLARIDIKRDLRELCQSTSE